MTTTPGSSGIKIVDIAPKVNAEVVDILECALAKAKAGVMTGVLLVEEDATGVEVNSDSLKDRWRAIGVLHHAIFKLEMAGK